METKTMYKVLLVTVLMLLMSIGIYIGLEISDNGKIPDDNIVVTNTDNIKVYNELAVDCDEEETEEIIDVTVKYSDVYPDCGHTIEQEEHYLQTTKEKIKNEIEEKDITYRLIGEEEGILLYQKVHTGRCMNHYMVSLEDEIVKIYRTNDTGEFALYQETEITRSMLREGIADKLEEGILVDDLEELFLLMEDIES